jgi:hypothetical protein
MDKRLYALSVGCYLDDMIIITARNDQEHLQNLTAVLQRLDQHGVKLKKSKCFFFKPYIQYLGFIVDARSLHPTPDKIEAIIDDEHPRYVTELQSFVGLVNYYR